MDQNGNASHSLSGHGIAGGLLSNPALAGSALSNHGLGTGALLPADIAMARNIPNRVHLLPPSSAFPSFSSASSSSSSSSPLSSGSNNNNNNNDVILTGIYSLNSVPRSRSRPTAPQSQSDSELSVHTSSSLINQALQSRTSSTSLPIQSKVLSLPQTLPPHTSASGPLVYTAVRKGTSSSGEGGVSASAGLVPHSWTRQYGTTQPHPWSSSSQAQPRPHSNPQPQLPPPQKPRVSVPAPNVSPSSEQTPRIQQVFTLSGKCEEDRLRSGNPSAPRSQETRRPTPRPLDASHNFSIAMETGNEEDEWQKEEELANMAAQTHIHREQALTSPTGAEVSVVRGRSTPPPTSSKAAVLHGNATLQGSYSLTVQTSPSRESSSQVGLTLVSAPWTLKGF